MVNQVWISTSELLTMKVSRVLANRTHSNFICSGLEPNLLFNEQGASMSDYNIEKQGDIYRIKGTRVALDSIIYQ